MGGNVGGWGVVGLDNFSTLAGPDVFTAVEMVNLRDDFCHSSNGFGKAAMTLGGEGAKLIGLVPVTSLWGNGMSDKE